MPNFMMISDPSLFPIPENKRFGGKGGGGGPKVDYEAEMRRQEELMNRQMELQQKFQIEAEQRMRDERERERQLELARRQQELQLKEEKMEKQESQESALFNEMTAQTGKESSEFGGGFNLAMPTIERPDYEREDRPL